MIFDPRRIFREAIYKKYLEGESSDDPLIIAPAYYRITLFYLLLMVIVIIFWLFLGALTIEIKGKGIFMKKDGIFGVESQSLGFVRELLVKSGNFVKKGEPLIKLYDSQQEIALHYATQQLANLQADYEKFKKEYEIEDIKTKASYEKQIESNKHKIEKLEKEIPDLENDYERRLALSKEGLVSTTTVLDSEKLLVQRRTALETAKATIKTLESHIKKSSHAEELQSLEQQILKQKEVKDLLELNEKYYQVISPFDAHVIEVLVYPGETVAAGKKLMWLESAEDQEIVVYAFAYMEIGKRVFPGQQILIQPASINQRDFGSLIGSVVEVSPYSIANKEIETYIHSKNLESYLTQGAFTPFLLTIKPELDPTTPSGFKWTSGKGIPFKISTGSVCFITGIAYYERPVVRLFPLWRVEVFFDTIEQWIYSWFKRVSTN